MGWTIRDFLLMNAPQFHHKINEKDLFENKNASSRIRSARLDYSLLSSGLSRSVLVCPCR